jgi:hypothetical protein
MGYFDLVKLDLREWRGGGPELFSTLGYVIFSQVYGIINYEAKNFSLGELLSL